ncbi:MAG: Glycine betaine/L-proline transport ATP-binding protein proV [Steroidobacteraceae bacterium]|jgi:glycine betaine/proline transport system ATP-binding protein|nr:Glycine betaine/L-proline transport ATP-binding protein proV [Steroidobacteraceae bacterium]
MSAALEFDTVDILFAPGTGRRRDAALRSALALLDQGQDRTQIETSTGVVVGVSGASLAVQRGQISVLMGLSGSGKSTLLRAANGLNRVTRGRVLVHDGEKHVDVARCDAATLRKLRRTSIAMIFQQFGLLPWRTVRENVGLGLELRGDSAATRKKIIDEKLELVGLSRWADRYAHELSGGMQQRVGLARAFATDAAILLMDEPFSALDPLIRTKLQDELLALQSRVRKTILFVTHDLDEALKLGNQTSVLEGGRIVQTGTSEDIVLRPASAYVGEFVQHMNPLSVLNGRMAMRPWSELPTDGQTRFLDAARHYAVAIDDQGRPVSASCGGAPLELRTTPAEGPGLLVADVGTPLRQLIQWCRAGHPVLLAEGGAVQGVCGPAEVIRALATSDARARAHG